MSDGTRPAASILVVEDNPANQTLIQAVLERDGYQVQMAGSAAVALACLEAARPNLILMDVGLPDRDGLSLARQILSESRTASVPIVALTAHAMPGDREAALAAGCVGHITKPIDTRRLGAVVRDHLGNVASTP
jgi:two-component system, cell cycle response regulator DivK